MSEFSSAPQTRLFTVFGTVLYVDAASGLLRHGPVESSPANAVFVADPGWGRAHRRGRLMRDSGSSLEPIVCLVDGCQIVSNVGGDGVSPTGTQLDLIPLERGLIALSAERLFLMADPTGQLSLSRPVCSTWECFLASEDWCADVGDATSEHIAAYANGLIDKKRVQSYLIHPLIRRRASAKSKATKVLIYGYPQWSHGRIYYDLCKQLQRRGYVVDILNWQENHAAYIAEIISFYDLFLTALDGVRTLVDVYNVPYERIIGVSHHELDIRMLTEQKGADVFDRFAAYCATSEFLYCASLMRGVRTIPMVAPVGVDYLEFYSGISERLATVGYASSMSVKTYGIEWKRGELAEAAAREAGLPFKVAGSTGNQMSFHDMPDFYRSVDAIVTSSISEAAQLPVMEAAAAGRLVIGTPVGHFPRKAYQGGGIMAPVEAEKFKAFTVETLRYYKESPSAYIEKCGTIQEAAKQFDWKFAIHEWVDLIETAIRRRIKRESGNAKSTYTLPKREAYLNGMIIENIIDGQTIRFFVTNPRDAVMKFHNEGSFYEMEELDIIRRHYVEGRTFVDIGANVGNHAIYISRFTNSSKVIVFEPNPVAVAVLRENLRLNACENVETRYLGMALASREGRLRGTTADLNNLGHTTYSGDTSGDVLAIPGDALIEEEPVEFIKIDVEGMEIDILAGLQKTIERWRPAIFIEVWDHLLLEFLGWCERASYRLVERYQRYPGIQNFLIKPLPNAGAGERNGTTDRKLSGLLDAVKQNPAAGTAWCELATGYREGGRPLEAAVVFARRAEMAGWAEEAWYARWQLARCLRDLNDEQGFVRTSLDAFRERIHRAEPLHDLANHYLATKRATPAAFYAEAALAIPKPEGDVLSVDGPLYQTGLRHTFAAIANWSSDAAQKERGRKVCDWLALSRDVPAHVRAIARYNAGWYVTSARSLLPSLQLHGLSLATRPNFHAAILSVCRRGTQLILVVRTVNWILKDTFWYVLQGTPPYRSHLLLVELDSDLSVVRLAYIDPPENMPRRYTTDIGVGDTRPFMWRGDLWCLSLVRQLNADGLSEMVLSRVRPTQSNGYTLTDWRVVPSGTPARDEKNWMPQLAGDELRLIYSLDPTRILTDSGTALHSDAAPIAADNFRGGSQAIEFDEGWLMVIHEVEQVNGRRRYFHRFVWMDSANVLRSLSRRFYLRQLGIEFVAGMAWHPDGERLVISFSVNDCEPCLAVVDATDVRAILLDIEEHRLASEQAVAAGRAALEQLKNGVTPIQ